MSTSPMISKSLSGNNRIEMDDPYSTLYVENLLGVKIEWFNDYCIIGVERMEEYTRNCKKYF